MFTSDRSQHIKLMPRLHMQFDNQVTNEIFVQKYFVLVKVTRYLVSEPD